MNFFEEEDSALLIGKDSPRISEDTESPLYENPSLLRFISEREKSKEVYYKKKKLLELIKQCTKEEHIEIFKLCMEDRISYSENNNGIFINLNNMSDHSLHRIFDYIEYMRVKKDELIIDDVKMIESKELLGESSKVILNQFELNKTIYKEYEFQDNHEKKMNDTIDTLLKDINTEQIDPSKISLKRKKNKYHGNMAKLINSFKEPKEPNSQKYNQHKSYSEEK
jgi:hypothetical protein